MRFENIHKRYTRILRLRSFYENMEELCQEGHEGYGYKVENRTSHILYVCETHMTQDPLGPVVRANLLLDKLFICYACSAPNK